MSPTTVLDPAGDQAKSGLVWRALAVTRLCVGLQQATDEADVLLALDRGLWELRLTGFVGRLEAGQGTVRIFAAQSGAAGSAVNREVSLAGAAALARTAQAQEAVFTADVEGDLGAVLPLAARNEAERSAMLQGFGRALCLPMTARGRTTGLLLVLGKSLEPDDETPLRLLANHLTVALENAALVRELKEAAVHEHAVADELRNMQEVVAGVFTESEASVGLQRLVLAAADALGVVRVGLYLANRGGGESRLGASVGLSTDLGDTLSQGPLAEPLRLDAGGDRPMIVADVRADPAWAAHRQVADAQAIRAVWSVPLVSPGGEPLGALVVFADRTGSPSAEQLRTAEQYARHAAMSIAAERSRERGTRDARVEAVATLARTVPHRLAQPLALVSGYAELIAEGLLEGEQLREACGKIVEAAQDMAELVQRLDRVNDYTTQDLGRGRTVLEI